MPVPLNRRYSRRHVWVLPLPDGDLRAGLTHAAALILGDVVYAELLPPGTDVAADEPIGFVESSSTVFEVYAPVAGVLSGINPDVETSPEKVGTAPYEEGWLFRLRPAEPRSPDALATAEEYARLVSGE